MSAIKLLSLFLFARKLAFNFNAVIVAAVAVALPFGAAVAQDPGSDRIILECGAAAVDEISLAECVSLKLEQAEATLEQVENVWQNLLQTSSLAQDNSRDNSQAISNQVRSTTSVPDQDDSQTESSGVIAIVNDSAFKSGVSTAGATVINIDEGDRPADKPLPDQLFDTSINSQERFGFLPSLFRSFRDQQCAWQTLMFGGDRTRLYYQACVAALTHSRALELTRYLAAQRSRATSGTSFRGYYVKTEAGAQFQACKRRTDWWVSGSESVLSALDRRYLDIKALSPDDSNLFYAELQGELTEAPPDGPGTDFSAVLSVREINVLRPVAETDCDFQEFTIGTLAAAQNADQTLSQAIVKDAATVDDYASSGFLYGYFNFWVAACAVTQNNVCSAETEAEFASDGDWKLRVDRSLEGDWRVMLISTTDDQVIEKQLTLQIDDADIFLDKSFSQPLRLPIEQRAEIANGVVARELVESLKRGRELRFQWFNNANVMSELKFSLIGLTRALQYFDNSKS